MSNEQKEIQETEQIQAQAVETSTVENKKVKWTSMTLRLKETTKARFQGQIDEGETAEQCVNRLLDTIDNLEKASKVEEPKVENPNSFTVDLSDQRAKVLDYIVEYRSSKGQEKSREEVVVSMVFNRGRLLNQDNVFDTGFSASKYESLKKPSND